MSPIIKKYFKHSVDLSPLLGPQDMGHEAECQASGSQSRFWIHENRKSEQVDGVNRDAQE